MIYRMIWHNLWRNSRRTSITVTSIAFAVLLAVSMKSLQKGVFDNLIKNMVSFYTGYIQVHKSGYWEEQTIENCFDYDTTLQRTLDLQQTITSSVARIESFMLASTGSRTRGCMVVGTQAANENHFTNLASKIVAGAYFSGNDQTVILAEGLAKKLAIRINDTLVFIGQGYQGNSAAGKYRIAGIARFGAPSLNESLAFLTLQTAQELVSAPNKITSLALNLNDPADLERTSSRIQASIGNFYEVLSWKKMMPDIDIHIRADNVNFYIFIGVLYLLIAFGLFGTVLMMLAERKYELGMLLAIGMKKRLMAGMLVGETILISVLGTLAGMTISFPVVKYFEQHPIRFSGKMAEAYSKFGFEATWPAAVDGTIFLTQALIVLGVALLIGLFPLIRIGTMQAITSMKR